MKKHNPPADIRDALFQSVVKARGDLAVTVDRKLTARASFEAGAGGVEVMSASGVSLVGSEGGVETYDVFNASEEPDSRADRGAGKVSHAGAAEQSLAGFGDVEDDGTPTIRATAGGKVTVETLGWMEKIRRKFGVPDFGDEVS